MPRRDGNGIVQRAHSLHGHQPPATDIVFKSTGSYRCGISVTGAPLDCQADLGAFGLNTEDSVFSCPSLQPPPSEAPPAPHLSPSPKKTAIPTTGMQYSQSKACHFSLPNPAFKNESLAGSTTTGIRPNQHWPPAGSETSEMTELQPSERPAYLPEPG